jgi:hypothetical protein
MSSICADLKKRRGFNGNRTKINGRLAMSKIILAILAIAIMPFLFGCSAAKQHESQSINSVYGVTGQDAEIRLYRGK